MFPDGQMRPNSARRLLSLCMPRGQPRLAGSRGEVLADKDAQRAKRRPSLRRAQLESRHLMGREGEIDMLLQLPAPPPASTPFLPSDTVFLLDTDADTRKPAAGGASPTDARVEAILSFLSDPEKARACMAMADIETPEYRPADTALRVGKTRGVQTALVRTSTNPAGHDRCRVFCAAPPLRTCRKETAAAGEGRVGRRTTAAVSPD